VNSIWLKTAAIAIAIAASGNNAWLNSAPLNADALHGKVVLVNFWTYSCINSLRPLPYVRSWAEKYKSAGLVVVGVHTPEFAFEKDRANVATAVRDLKLQHPIVMDSDSRIWQAFRNDAWPAFYLIDGSGRIRNRYAGEGDYAKIERDLQKLLRENGARDVSPSVVNVSGAGIEAPANFTDEESPETYVGSEKAERIATNGSALAVNQWRLSGPWSVGPESALLAEPRGKIAFRFHSRDLHLVLGSADGGAPVRYRVTLDGAAPGPDCGGDCGADGIGEVREPRLYQLIRQKGIVRDRTFEVEFLDPGVRAYVFTFG
jgi:thiol-disulfide isomerase/thioredoxin